MMDDINSSFERNRYFKGKLMTTRDFEMEQKYFNDKRRLLNRLFFGGGIVCGLQVIKIDEKTISIEKGLAIDSSGREVMLEKNIIMDKGIITAELNKLEGLEDEEFMKDLYLCIQFKEEEKDLVNSVLENKQEHNLVKDSYEIFLSDESPDASDFGLSYLIEDKKLLCVVEDIKETRTVKESQRLKVWQTVPRFVNPGDVFEIVVTVEKGYFSDAVRLEYEIESEEFEPIKKDGFKISYSENLKNKDWLQSYKCLVRAKETLGNTSGKIRIKDGKMKISIGDRQYIEEVQLVNSPKIIVESLKERVLNEYSNRGFDDAMASNKGNAICLARVSFYKYKSSYSIEGVERVRANEYAVSLPLMRVLDNLDKKHDKNAAHLKDENIVGEVREFLAQTAATSAKTYSSGIQYIDFNSAHKVGNKYFTENEISHELGIGPVYIGTGLELNYQDTLSGILNNDSEIFYGSNMVFENSDYAPDLVGAEIGVVLYPNRGTFRIGVSIPPQKHKMQGIQGINVRWWAFRK